MILTVTLNPCVDHAVFVDALAINDVNRVMRTETDAGGKGVNLSRVAVELGSKSVATGFAGGGAGAYVRGVLDEQGVEHAFVPIAGETRTNFSIEDRTGLPPTHLNARGPHVSESEWSQLLATVERYSGEASWVCLAGSMCQGVPADAYRLLGEIVRRSGAQLMLDADGEPLRHGLKAIPNFIKPNESEAERLLGYPVHTLEEAAGAARALYGSLGEPEAGVHRIVVLSRGAKGAIMACQEGIFEGRSPQVEPRSTVGSGDSMIAGMLAALERGESLPEALHWGLAAGAATASTDGTKIARKAVVELLYAQASVRAL